MPKKKTFVKGLLMIMLLSTIVEPTSVFAQENTNNIHTKQYPQFVYNGVDEVYLGTFELNDEDQSLLIDNYREYDTYKVYDEGIISQWNWLSKPYFIISIAKGESYISSKTVKATITGNISGNFPSGARIPIFKAFGISSSGSKTVYEEVRFSGPTGSARTRDFYYKKGTHKHTVRVVQEHRSNWDGLLWTKTYRVNVSVPAILHYSVDH